MFKNTFLAAVVAISCSKQTQASSWGKIATGIGSGGAVLLGSYLLYRNHQLETQSNPKSNPKNQGRISQTKRTLMFLKFRQFLPWILIGSGSLGGIYLAYAASQSSNSSDPSALSSDADNPSRQQIADSITEQNIGEKFPLANGVDKNEAVKVLKAAILKGYSSELAQFAALAREGLLDQTNEVKRFNNLFHQEFHKELGLSPDLWTNNDEVYEDEVHENAGFKKLRKAGFEFKAECSQREVWKAVYELVLKLYENPAADEWKYMIGSGEILSQDNVELVKALKEYLTEESRKKAFTWEKFKVRTVLEQDGPPFIFASSEQASREIFEKNFDLFLANDMQNTATQKAWIELGNSFDQDAMQRELGWQNFLRNEMATPVFFPGQEHRARQAYDSSSGITHLTRLDHEAFNGIIDRMAMKRALAKKALNSVIEQLKNPDIFYMGNKSYRTAWAPRKNRKDAETVIENWVSEDQGEIPSFSELANSRKAAEIVRSVLMNANILRNIVVE